MHSQPPILQGDNSEKSTPLCLDDDLLHRTEEVTSVLKALSHNQRLLIVCTLMQGEKSVHKLQKITGLRQSVVSQQLSKLRRVGIVGADRRGKFVYYHVSCERTRKIIHLLREEFNDNIDILQSAPSRFA